MTGCRQGGMVAMGLLYPLDQIKTIMQGTSVAVLFISLSVRGEALTHAWQWRARRR